MDEWYTADNSPGQPPMGLLAARWGGPMNTRPRPSTIVAVKGILWDGERALLVQRSPDERSGADAWEFPGGVLHFAEQPEECLLREVREETGLVVEPLRLLYATTFVITDQVQVVSLTYLCRPVSGSLCLSHEHQACHWASLQEMRELLEDSYLDDAERNGVFALLAAQAKEG